jgi:hypothetical protein
MLRAIRSIRAHLEDRECIYVILDDLSHHLNRGIIEWCDTAPSPARSALSPAADGDAVEIRGGDPWTVQADDRIVRKDRLWRSARPDPGVDTRTAAVVSRRIGAGRVT